MLKVRYIEYKKENKTITVEHYAVTDQVVDLRCLVVVGGLLLQLR